MLRSITCGELTARDAEKKVVLCGWVDSIRDLGGIYFVLLRDRYGITQCTFIEEENRDLFERIKSVKSEHVLKVSGTVKLRSEKDINKKMKTGEIEVLADDFEILSTSKLPPFEIKDEINVSEELRLKYRYLDLRRPKMQENFILRHKVALLVRNFLSERNFLEIETPFLTKSTPEGARDYLVPSRMYPGRFYALPQSPQLFKQLLMISGFDRYFQIVKCFRDEDLRADRQPEFTQIDIELSFLEMEDIFNLIEPMMVEIFRLIGVEVSTPFLKMDYEEAVENYGSDRPDLRFDMKLFDISDFFVESEFKIFREIVNGGGVIKAIKVEGCAKYSRKRIDELNDFVKIYGAKGLAWIKLMDGNFKSSLPKVVGENTLKLIFERLKGGEGDIVLIVGGKREIVNTSLGELRRKIAVDENFIKDGDYKFLWVTDFPMFEYSEEDGRFYALHHPFTAPVEILEDNPLEMKSMAYDIVLNGLEIGGGSIRNHRVDVQNKIFEILGIDEREREEKFGFFLEALQYGTPPHGGIALGLDRIVMILAGENSIRNVIPFPKTTSALCLLTGSPSKVDISQLEELKIKIIREE